MVSTSENESTSSFGSTPPSSAKPLSIDDNPELDKLILAALRKILPRQGVNFTSNPPEPPTIVIKESSNTSSSPTPATTRAAVTTDYFADDNDDDVMEAEIDVGEVGNDNLDAEEYISEEEQVSIKEEEGEEEESYKPPAVSANIADSDGKLFRVLNRFHGLNNKDPTDHPPHRPRPYHPLHPNRPPRRQDNSQKYKRPNPIDLYQSILEELSLSSLGFDLSSSDDIEEEEKPEDEDKLNSSSSENNNFFNNNEITAYRVIPKLNKNKMKGKPQPAPPPKPVPAKPPPPLKPALAQAKPKSPPQKKTSDTESEEEQEHHHDPDHHLSFNEKKMPHAHSQHSTHSLRRGTGWFPKLQPILPEEDEEEDGDFETEGKEPSTRSASARAKSSKTKIKGKSSGSSLKGKAGKGKPLPKGAPAAKGGTGGKAAPAAKGGKGSKGALAATSPPPAAKPPPPTKAKEAQTQTDKGKSPPQSKPSPSPSPTPSPRSSNSPSPSRNSKEKTIPLKSKKSPFAPPPALTKHSRDSASSKASSRSRSTSPASSFSKKSPYVHEESKYSGQDDDDGEGEDPFKTKKELPRTPPDPVHKATETDNAQCRPPLLQAKLISCSPMCPQPQVAQGNCCQGPSSQVCNCHCPPPPTQCQPQRIIRPPCCIRPCCLVPPNRQRQCCCTPSCPARDFAYQKGPRLTPVDMFVELQLYEDAMQKLRAKAQNACCRLNQRREQRQCQQNGTFGGDVCNLRQCCPGEAPRNTTCIPSRWLTEYQDQFRNKLIRKVNCTKYPLKYARRIKWTNLRKPCCPTTKCREMNDLGFYQGDVYDENENEQNNPQCDRSPCRGPCHPKQMQNCSQTQTAQDQGQQTEEEEHESYADMVMRKDGGSEILLNKGQEGKFTPASVTQPVIPSHSKGR